eukprot:TRINITY_DN26641_c0_g1_i1.p1 TRINITY_DN26641_c0_g1~~TRINITY_DN26641_c0_g1_i1.p1  ORF type:complete len:539 (-),score=104.26 TRINITY_DN26641_c0_g1_i1:96-1652(-)
MARDGADAAQNGDAGAAGQLVNRGYPETSPTAGTDRRDVAPAPRDGKVMEDGLEIRWMASGHTACLLPAVVGNVHVGALKEGVRERAGIPVAEQRLFAAGGVELRTGDDCAMVGVGSGAVCDSEGGSPSPTCQSLLLVRAFSDPRLTDVSQLRYSAATQQLPSGFTFVRRLAKAIHGEVLLYHWDRPESADHRVAVKTIPTSSIEQLKGKETDERRMHLHARNVPDPEDALTEIGVFSILAEHPDVSPYLLRMLGVFEDGRSTWLVTEFADGGELYDVVASGNVIAERDVKQYGKQLLEAVTFLHRCNIGHRDISLENVLLKDKTVRLMDFGMAVRSHSKSGVPLRYFRSVGKDFYRAPECYLPTGSSVSILVPRDATPGAVSLVKCGSSFCEVQIPANVLPEESCTAELWGYTVHPADVFSCAVCFFIMLFQCPPWCRAQLSDEGFRYMHASGEDGLRALLRSYGKRVASDDAMRLLQKMFQVDPALRPSAAQCIDEVWLLEQADVAMEPQPAAFAA